MPSDLELFLEGIEFITEYPRLIERAKRDTIRKRTAYQYRELIGDHPLVPIQTAKTSQAELEEKPLRLQTEVEHSIYFVHS